MFCSHCGKEIPDTADVCLNCGHLLKQVGNTPKPDAPSRNLWWIGFLIPLLGLILWAVWSGSYPKRARSIGHGAVWALIIYELGLLIYLLIAILSITGIF